MSSVLADPREIESIGGTCFNVDGEELFYRIGYADVERIEVYAEPAQCSVHWFRIIRSGCISERVPGAAFVVRYKASE